MTDHPAEPTTEALSDEMRDAVALSSPAPTDRAQAIEECAELVDGMISNWRNNKAAQQLLALAASGIRALLTTQPSEDGWIKVSPSHPLPDDLKVGDEIEIKFNGKRGPAEEGSGRYRIFAVKMGGEHRLYQVDEYGDWWLDAIVAYRRASGE